MQAVWKETLSLSAEPQTVSMDADAPILHLDKQEGCPTIWFQVDPTNIRSVDRRFQLFGTGFVEIPDDATYVGTIFHGWLVLHLYELAR